MSEWIEFMDTNNLMNRAQHAAKKHSGTLTNLTEYLDFVTKLVDSMNQTEVLGFDMSLAFDRARFALWHSFVSLALRRSRWRSRLGLDQGDGRFGFATASGYGHGPSE